MSCTHDGVAGIRVQLWPRLFQQAVSTSGDYSSLFNMPEATQPGGAENLDLQDCKSKLPTY
jgi:hypothetical protein